MSRRPLLALAITAWLVGATCQESAPAPVAGELTVNLTTPNNDDGALLVRVTGSGANTISGGSAACAGCKLFFAQVSDTEFRAVITGTINAGAVARVAVSDVNNPASYSAQILDAASRTYVRRATTGYSLSLQ
jgi:hydroxyethylthiazole kinase-like sugar kinase family protein